MILRCTYAPDSPAERNMALDRAMMDAAEPCLRLYTWAPPAITLGNSQDDSILDLETCRREGIAVVHRFTGGAAVLHKDDLTYAFFYPAAAPPPYRAIDIRERFKQIFLASFRDLGVEAEEAGDVKWRMPDSAICFHGQAANEILIGGKKVAGNAQRLTRKGIFQHGSILLRDNEDLFCRLVRGATPTGQTTGLADHGAAPDPARLAERMIHHAGEVFGLDVVVKDA